MRGKSTKGCLFAFVLGMALCFCACAEIEKTYQSGANVEYIDVEVEESFFADRLYYEQLNEDNKQIYREIYQGIINREESFAIHSKDGKRAGELCAYVVYDFPEIFWVDGSCEATTYEGSHTVLSPKYTCSVETKEEKQAEIEAAAEEILSGVPNEGSEYEKIKYIYETLVNQVDYVENAPDNQNIYSALVNKKTVCAGYAKANQYLLNQLGIYCAYVTGTANGGAHAWNIVQCDGEYYYVDVTWADPLFAGGAKPENGEMVYDYLCCSESVISGTHVAEEGIVYPSCTSDDLNYYGMNDSLFASADEDELLTAMKASIDQMEGSTTFKFASKSVYDEAKSVLTGSLMEKAAKYLAEEYGLTQVSYSYEDAVELNKIVIYWKYE